MKIEKLITHLYRYALRSGENHSVICNNRNDIKIIKSDKGLSPSINIIVGGNLCISISTIEIIKADYFDTNDIGFYLVITNLDKKYDQVFVLYQNGKTIINDFKKPEDKTEELIVINEPPVHVKNNLIDAYIYKKNALDAVEKIFKKLKIDKFLAEKYGFPKKQKKVEENV